MRLELTRLAPPPPQDGVSTNSTTSATISASAATTASARIHGLPGELHKGLTETGTTPIAARGVRRLKKILLEFAPGPRHSPRHSPRRSMLALLPTESCLRVSAPREWIAAPARQRSANGAQGERTHSTWERRPAWPASARYSPRARPSVRLCPRPLPHLCRHPPEPPRSPARHPMHPSVDPADARP